MEAIAFLDSARTTTPLLEVSVGRPHSGVLNHVIVRGECFNPRSRVRVCECVRMCCE